MRNPAMQERIPPANFDLSGNLLYWRGSAHAFPFGDGAPPSLQRGSCGAEEVRQALAQLHAFRRTPAAPLPTSLALGHPPQRGGLYPDKSKFENMVPLVFCENHENYALLLGKLMIISKGWREPDAIIMPVAQLWEKAVFSTPPAPTWLLGNIKERWIFP